MEDCMFCKVIKGDLPSTKIYEDDHTFAFFDISPINKGHTLVVPKKHVVNLFDVDDPTFKATMETVKKITKALEQYSDGVNVIQNNNEAAGQVIFHLHVHVIPRFKEDGIRYLIKNRKETYEEGEAVKVAEDIKKLL